ncbi:hypothetical protein OOK13_44270 [Streptomyces sp. NBC_00378]|uniref:hypothetical protein n=1 Tax=unclassified Streptomyces TaxID=2593676 RepID=UPI0022507D18|nr:MULTISPECIES: hypothetical protein [unclassified Streptomyces]MCX5115329.1 hypothetical protein [Streptomyces sp. NBC_00378]
MQPTLTEQRLIGLARTLTHVREHSPFYRGLISAGEIGPADAPALLRALPRLDPHSWASNRARLRTTSPGSVVTGFTNGTSGVPKAFCSTETERAALRASRRDDGRRRLHLAGVSHGAVVGLDLAEEGDFVPLLSMRYADMAADLIAHGAADGTRIRVLVGTTRHIKILTLHMLRRFGDLSGFGIETVEIGRDFLSPAWETRLRTWWGADVENVYGFSELRMCNARKCRTCAHHHFPPSCVAEVVDPTDPDRYVPLGGRGSLLVTALHPYVEFEPRIRYRPGDMVQLAPHPCPQWGEPGFLPLGREAHCVTADENGGYLTPADCVSVLADLPQVAVAFDHLYPDTDRHHYEAGNPRFRLVDNGSGPEVHVELRFDPLVWPDRADGVSATIRDALTVDARVVLYGPDRLDDPILV